MSAKVHTLDEWSQRQLERTLGGNLSDIPARLHGLAEAIRRGEHGDVHQLAWVMTDGVPRKDPEEVGLLGRSASVAAELHLLLTRGAHVITDP